MANTYLWKISQMEAKISDGEKRMLYLEYGGN